MKIAKLPAVIAVLAGSFFPFGSQAEDISNSIPGYLNPSTGVFTTRPALTPAASSVVAKATINITFTVILDSTIPLSQTVTCSASLSSFDNSFINSASAENNVVKSSASAGTCTISIPYVWEILSTSTPMSVNVSVSTSSGYSAGITRNASKTIASFAVPTTGTKNIAVTLAL